MRRSIIGWGFVWGLMLLYARPLQAQHAPGPLTKEHALFAGPDHCRDCHISTNGKFEFKCLNCHGGVLEDQKSGRHITLGENVTSNVCSGCHALHSTGAAKSVEASQHRANTGSPHGSLAIACRNCHTSTSFTPIRPFPDFRHSETRFPLRGMHEEVSCRQCHASLVFDSVGRQCADCHADFHRRQMGSNCAQCHTVRGWRVSMTAVNNHTNRFPLIGAHMMPDCESCHKNGASGQYKGLSTECACCHLRDFTAAKSPDHQAAKFSTDCRSCHSGMDSWLEVKFDHSTGFRLSLTGAHAQLDCAACHGNNNYPGTPSTCISCHSSDYSGTSNPNHASAGFSQNCQDCHSADGWATVSFDHGTATKFQLSGAHSGPLCAACHINNVYAGLSTACESCHSADYARTTDPNHAEAGFPQQCAACHNSTSWAGAVFNHGSTSFVLTGAHADGQCSSCHENKVYAGLPVACVSCHLTDFNGTTNPGHQAAGFPTSCATCHTTTAWTGATFTHTWFRTTHGNAGTCSDCHPNSSNYSVFTCTVCHTQAQMDSTHRGRSGYVYNSVNCYQCHRSGGD